MLEGLPSVIKTLDLSPALKESKSQLHRRGEKSCHCESGHAMPEAGPSSQREPAPGGRHVWTPEARETDRGKTTAVIMGEGLCLDLGLCSKQD